MKSLTGISLARTLPATRIALVFLTLALSFFSLVGVIIVGKNFGFSPAQFKDPNLVFSPSTMTAVLAVLLVPIGIVVFVQRYIHRESVPILFGSRVLKPMTLGFGLGLAVKGIALIAAMGLATNLQIERSIPSVTTPGLTAVIVWYGVTLFLNSLNEELVYRAYPIHQLKKSGVFSEGAVVLGTAAVFSLMHFVMESPDLFKFLYRSAFGIASALLLLRTTSLWVIVGFHTGWNFVALSFSDTDWRLGGLFTITGLRPGSEQIANVVVLTFLSLVLLGSARRAAADDHLRNFS